MQLINVDIFKIAQTKQLDFVMMMLNMNSHGLKHALSALISVLVSMPQGIQYLT